MARDRPCPYDSRGVHRRAGAWPPQGLTVARDRPSPYSWRGVHRRAGAWPPQGLTAELPLREPLFFFRSVRTYMSIETVSGSFSRSARTLIMSGAPEAMRLRSFRTLAFLMSLLAIDMQVLTDLKSQGLVSSCAVRDQAIPNYRWMGHHFRINILPVAMNAPAVRE